VETLIKKMEERVATVVPNRVKGQNYILVVDDDPNIRMMLRQELEAAGYSVREASNGMEAVGMVKKDMPDLILLDVMMPGMNGFDVAAVLKNDPATMNIPIIILSIIEDKERGYRIGVDRYFKKPLNVEELLKEIGELITRGGSKKKVLVVDEDKSTLNTLIQVLQTRGFMVVGASDSEECLKVAVSEKPDMIILDTLFSERYDVVKTLRLEKGFENVLFVFTGKH